MAASFIHSNILDNDQNVVGGKYVTTSSEVELIGTTGTTPTSKWYNICKLTFYFIVYPSIYICYLILSILFTSNAYHLFSWLSTLFCTSYIVFTSNALIFSQYLFYHTVNYQEINGIYNNYSPTKINMHNNRPVNSISLLYHVRGSSLNKLHVFFSTFASYPVISGSIIKLFDNYNYDTQQIVSIYLLLFAGIGGILMGNIETYTSPSFSAKHNTLKHVIHIFGASLWAIIGNLAYLLYVNGSIFSIYLFSTMFSGLIFCRTNRAIQYKMNNPKNTTKSKIQYAKWVHRMSIINVGVELVAISHSSVAICTMLYQFGSE